MEVLNRRVTSSDFCFSSTILVLIRDCKRQRLNKRSNQEPIAVIKLGNDGGLEPRAYSGGGGEKWLDFSPFSYYLLSGHFIISTLARN